MTRGKRVISPEVMDEMQMILDEIQTGQFATEWILENQAGRPSFRALERLEAEHPMEEVGKRIRAMMPWLSE
jgi:ketol-acid reductoisomerase